MILAWTVTKKIKRFAIFMKVFTWLEILALPV